MLTIKTSPQKSETIIEDIYGKPLGNDYDSNYITTKMLPFLLNKEYLTKISDRRFIVDIPDWKIFMVVSTRDNWNTIKVVTNEKPSNETVNIYTITEHGKKIVIEELNSEMVHKYLQFYARHDPYLDLSGGHYSWLLLSTESALITLSTVRYIVEYQADQLDRTEVTVDLNRYEAHLKKLEKEKKERKNKANPPKEKKQQEKAVQVHPAKTETSETSEDSSKVIQLTDKCKKMESEMIKFRHLYREEKNKNKELLAELQRLEKENEKLKSDPLFNKEEIRSENERKTASEEVMKEALRGKKILIIGGHDNWFRRLSEYLPDCNFTFVGVEEYTKKVTLSDNAEFIFFFTNHVDHCIYNRHLDYIRLHGYAYEYINTTNLEKNLEQMYGFLQKKKNGTEN